MGCISLTLGYHLEPNLETIFLIHQQCNTPLGNHQTNIPHWEIIKKTKSDLTFSTCKVSRYRGSNSFESVIILEVCCASDGANQCPGRYMRGRKGGKRNPVLPTRYHQLKSLNLSSGKGGTCMFHVVLPLVCQQKVPWDITFSPRSIREQANSSKKVPWPPQARMKEMLSRSWSGRVSRTRQRVRGCLEGKGRPVSCQ